MVYWVWKHSKEVKRFDEVYIATDSEQIEAVAESFGAKVIMTSFECETATERLYEVSQKIDADLYVMINGDEPLVLAKDIVKCIPEAIPDDADLKASLITKNSKEYNYDAYMKALNDGKDKEAYTEDNTLLYDLAFMKDGKELEPTEGTVSVTFDFKNDQLSEDLGAKKASDVNVIHLPLKDSVRDKFDSTKAAKSIDEDDINKEEIRDKDLDVSLSKETVKFETKDFSVFAYTVDFTHDEYTYSIAGEDSIMLSDLFKELKIDEDLDNVKDVDFSDPKLIKVTEKDSDWDSILKPAPSR